MTTPTKPGFYWAKWMIADDHVPEGYTPFKTWEPVEVYWADRLDGPDDELRAQLIGHDFSQSLDCFHWGDRLEPPVDRTAGIKNETQSRELEAARTRYLKMTAIEREEFLQARRRRS